MLNTMRKLNDNVRKFQIADNVRISKYKKKIKVIVQIALKNFLSFKR